MPLGARYKPKNKNELLNLLKDGIECRDIDFSLLVDLEKLFYYEEDILLQNNVYFVDPNNPNLLIWNTSNVTNMSGMFKSCKNFNKEIKLDTSNVINMKDMFSFCGNFDQLLNFNTSNVINMEDMFYGCRNFNQPINFDTSSVINMNRMFMGCRNFNQPINFDTSNVTNMNRMFKYCKNLNSKIELKNIGKNTNEVKINELFYECDKLEFKNIQLDIKDCNKLDGDKIYKDMDKDDFCNFIQMKNNFDVSKIIDKLKNLMFS